MGSQSDLPNSDPPAVQGAVGQWPEHRHRKRKRHRFSTRKTKKMVRIALIVAAHVILIVVLIYIWIKIAYSSTRLRSPKDGSVVAVGCLVPAKRDSERMLKPRFKAFGILGLMRQITFTQLSVGTQAIQIAFGPADDSLINGRRDRRDVRISGYVRDCHRDENGELSNIRHGCAFRQRNALGDWRLA